MNSGIYVPGFLWPAVLPLEPGPVRGRLQGRCAAGRPATPSHLLQTAPPAAHVAPSIPPISPPPSLSSSPSHSTHTSSPAPPSSPSSLPLHTPSASAPSSLNETHATSSSAAT